METPIFFTQQQMDFLDEVVNVSGGNAARVMEQMLQLKVDMGEHSVEVCPLDQIEKVLEGTGDIKACVHAQVVGDLKAEMFFTLSTRQYRAMVRQIREVASLSPIGKITDADILAEFGNVLMGTYITALHDFCRLNIIHTVPDVVVDMTGALLDEAIAHQAQEHACILIIRNDFVISSLDIHALLLLLLSPTTSGLQTLLGSIDAARDALTGGR